MTAGLWIKEKNGPHESWGPRVITMTTRYKNCRSRQESNIASRCDSTSALSYREHLPWIVVLTVSSRLLALFTPNSGEGLPKVRINASRVTKRMIEDRFHLGP